MATRTVISFMINALIIFSTTHAQDFRDEVGDKLIGRRTIPIVWPKGSRVGIFVMLIAWSVGLSWAFGLASFFSVPFCMSAVLIGLRFLRKRTADADQRSYYYYNVRISHQ
jgi:4-hydroxybenzoate polyprenyltransferase